MLTMASALLRARRHFARSLATIDEDGTRTTWAGHMDRVARLAGALRAMGLAPGERFAVIAPNSVRQCELIHAGYWSGTVPVPVNFRLAPPEITSIVLESRARVIFIASQFLPLGEHLKAEGWSGTFVLLDAPSEPESFDDLLASGEPMEIYDADEGTEALLLYTGGTTGAGKGVPLSHGNIVGNGLQVAQALGTRPDDVMLHVAPMFHSADLLGTAVTLAGGAHSYLAAPAPDAFIDAVVAREITYTMVPPVILHGVVAGNLLEGRNLDSLRIFISGGAPVPFELLEAAQAFLPNGSMVQGYGLTETSPILTFMHLQQTAGATGAGSDACRSAGRPLAGIDLRLVDDGGHDVRAGGIGELVVRGPNVMAGYLDRPQATAEALRDGWFHTGDVARLDEHGFVHIVDRKKDVIITGGENVYSAEVETVLRQHPSVGEVAVIGIPDETYGETVLAVVVTIGDDRLREDEIQDFCRGQIGGYKVPRRIVFVQDLPKSALGKVLKSRLRSQHA